jgi:hypothetical protein
VIIQKYDSIIQTRKKERKNNMDETKTKSCVHCENNVLCRAYKDMGEAMNAYGLLTTAPGQAWKVIVVEMAENCKYFKEYID